jgi:KUP system potassium uptake protein
MLVCGLFLFFEVPFCAANLLKLGQGGWLTLLIATAIFTVMTTWKTGRRLLGRRLAAGILPLDLFLADIRRQPPTRVGGSAIFMSSNPEGTPIALLHNLRHNRVLHERSVILSIAISETAHVHPSKRVVVETLGEGIYRVIGTFGFMDDPSIREVLELCTQHGLPLSVREATFFLGRETVVPSSRPGMARWRQGLFAFLARNAQSANRVVELGLQVEV